MTRSDDSNRAEASLGTHGGRVVRAGRDSHPPADSASGQSWPRPGVDPDADWPHRARRRQRLARAAASARRAGSGVSIATALAARGRRRPSPSCCLPRPAVQLEFLGDILVGTRRGLGPVPGTVVGIDLGSVTSAKLRARPVSPAATPTSRSPSAPADDETSTRAPNSMSPPASQPRTLIASHEPRSTSRRFSAVATAPTLSRRRGPTGLRRGRLLRRRPEVRAGTDAYVFGNGPGRRGNT